MFRKRYIYIYINKGKGIPITGHEGPRGMWMQGSTYSQPWHLEEVGWLVLCFPVFTPGMLWYTFYTRWSGPQGQSRNEGVKKNLHHSATWDRTWAIQHVSQVAWATCPTSNDSECIFCLNRENKESPHNLKHKNVFIFLNKITNIL